jgi:hypothetical protein
MSAMACCAAARGDRRRGLCRGLRPPGRARARCGWPSVGAIAAALSNATPRIDQFSVSEPGAEALVETYVEGSGAQTLPPGAWQLRPHLSTGARKYQVAWGPVFGGVGTDRVRQLETY